ncbi:MAG TPA: biopolymer transporter ExbD [Mariprofundaceae bacterium]|nr:biopolymer transporter ExbD [Mariprofundaceae bacterium]
MNLRNKRGSEASIDLTPLVDVVFMLLLFFMVTTSFNVSTSLKLNLPTSQSTAKEQEAKEVKIQIDSYDQLYVQDEKVSDDDLRRRILNISKGDPNMRVVIQADANSRHKRLVLVLDTLRELGMGKVGIATVPPGGQ